MFHSRLKSAIIKSGKTYQEISLLSGVDKRSIDGYMGKKNPSKPLVDSAVALAIALDLTVEELALGDDGRDYVINWAGRNGAQWRPPPHLEELCDDLKRLDRSSIEIVKATVKKILELTGEGAVSESNPQAKIS